MLEGASGHNMAWAPPKEKLTSNLDYPEHFWYSQLEGSRVAHCVLSQDSTSVQKSALTMCNGCYWLHRRQDRELKSRMISTGEGQSNLAFQLLCCSLVSWLNSYLLLAGPGSFVLSAAEVTLPHHHSPKVAERVLPISFSSRWSLPAQLCPSVSMNV